jgi:sugar transferase (PEP-CTERM/EpsH1 system associated)
MNILFLTHRLPYAPNRGDRIRAYFLLREMAKFADVALFSLVHDAAEQAQASHVPFARSVVTARVSSVSNWLRGIALLPTGRPLTHSLLRAPGIKAKLAKMVAEAPPDVVVAFCSGMARFAMTSPLSRIPCIVDLVDVDSAKWRALALASRGPRRWIYAREARTLGAFEARAIRQAHATLVVNGRELRALEPALTSRVVVVPNGVDVGAFRPSGPPVDNPVVVFCGVMDYAPNDAGVRWFIDAVWPKVRAARPDARFVVIGGGATRELQAVAAADSTVRLAGGVESVQEYLHAAAVSVAPLHVARGLQNKVLEAIAARLPVVVTPAVLDGLPKQAKSACMWASSPEDFAAFVIALLGQSGEDRRQLADSADLSGLDWSAQLGGLERLLKAAAQTQGGPGGQTVV